MKNIHKVYEYDYGSGRIRLKNKKCSRCGVVMAFHLKPTPRHACGRCGYTEFIRR